LFLPNTRGEGTAWDGRAGEARHGRGIAARRDGQSIVWRGQSWVGCVDRGKNDERERLQAWSRSRSFHHRVDG